LEPTDEDKAEIALKMDELLRQLHDLLEQETDDFICVPGKPLISTAIH
jgi:hypothetical protein